MKVQIFTKTVGQCFGTNAVIREKTSGKLLHTTTIRPFGFTQAAIKDAESIANTAGWEVVFTH